MSLKFLAPTVDTSIEKRSFTAYIKAQGLTLRKSSNFLSLLNLNFLSHMSLPPPSGSECFNTEEVVTQHWDIIGSLKTNNVFL